MTTASDEYLDPAKAMSSLDVDPASERLVSDLLMNCQILVDELELFQQYLVTQRKEINVELRHYRGSVKTELKSLEKLSVADPTAERTLHTIRSSNFPFYAAVWNVVKTCTGVIALQKRFYWAPGHQPDGDSHFKPTSSKHKKQSALIDIVADNGAEWIKVSSVTAKRILFDMAKNGWVEDDSSDDEYDNNRGSSDDDDDSEGLMKQAEAMVKASKAIRIRYRHPRLRILLPKVELGLIKEVDNLIEKIRSLGISVETGGQVKTAPPIKEVLGKLAVDPFADFSDILNVDCTVLLAFVSDLSHCHVDPENWHHKAILRQIEVERENHLLPNSLFPACGSRKLVCTREAATRMYEIVSLIGTDTEKERTAYLMDAAGATPKTKEERIEGFRRLTEYDIPENWNLPIEIVDVDIEKIKGDLPPVAQRASEGLSDINKSVFLYGWYKNYTTISSNRTVAKEIESSVENSHLSEEDEGPHIWLCPTARSLVGKEKTRRQ